MATPGSESETLAFEAAYAPAAPAASATTRSMIVGAVRPTISLFSVTSGAVAEPRPHRHADEDGRRDPGRGDDQRPDAPAAATRSRCRGRSRRSDP